MNLSKNPTRKIRTPVKVSTRSQVLKAVKMRKHTAIMRSGAQKNVADAVGFAQCEKRKAMVVSESR